MPAFGLGLGFELGFFGVCTISDDLLSELNFVLEPFLLALPFDTALPSESLAGDGAPRLFQEDLSGGSRGLSMAPQDTDLELLDRGKTD